MAIEQLEREMQVLAVFRQLLQAPALGLEENFFEAGGSSLLAARLASLLRAAGVLDVPTSAIFAAPTARALTRYSLQLLPSPAIDSTGEEGVAASASPSLADPSLANTSLAAPAHATPSLAAARGAQQRAAFARLRATPSPASAPGASPLALASPPETTR